MCWSLKSHDKFWTINPQFPSCLRLKNEKICTAKKKFPLLWTSAMTLLKNSYKLMPPKHKSTKQFLLKYIIFPVKREEKKRKISSEKGLFWFFIWWPRVDSFIHISISISYSRLDEMKQEDTRKKRKKREEKPWKICRVILESSQIYCSLMILKFFIRTNKQNKNMFLYAYFSSSFLSFSFLFLLMLFVEMIFPLSRLQKVTKQPIQKSVRN